MSTQGNAVSDVVVVSSQRTFAELLCEAVDSQEDLNPAGFAVTIESAVALCAGAAPDAVVVDGTLPDGDGLDAAERILAVVPSARIILLTTGPGRDVLSRAADAGVSGLLPMNGPLGGLLDAIRRARPGAMTVHPSLLVPAVRSVNSEQIPVLTRRERQVLTLLAEGSDVPTTARTLNIAQNTCRGYVKSILAKLGAHSQLQAVASARRLQLLA